METFTPPRLFVPHPEYLEDRKRAHQDLHKEIEKNEIDLLLLPLINECLAVQSCFTVQCCWGHFVHRLEPDPENLVPLSHYKDVKDQIGTIRYRIAYLAVCLEDSPGGHEIYDRLERMAEQTPSFIQFGSADWFSGRMPNIWCIQLEPERMKTEDSGPVTWDEAVRIEELKGPFFAELMDIMHRHRDYMKETGRVIPKI